jgi:hypothetical protein
MNPFLNKPLKKVQSGNSTESRPSKVINPNNMAKNVKQPDKKPSEAQPPNNVNKNVSQDPKSEEIIGKKMFIANMKRERVAEIFLPKVKRNELIFESDEDIFEYLKGKIKDGKIKNLSQKLDLKKSDFTGFSLTRKNNGLTAYELEIESELDKVNESIKSHKMEICKRPVELIYSEDVKVINKPKIAVANKTKA